VKRGVLLITCCAALTVALVAGIGPASARRTPASAAKATTTHARAPHVAISPAVRRTLRDLLGPKSEQTPKAAPCVLEGGICVHPCTIPVASSAGPLKGQSCSSTQATQPCRELIAQQAGTESSRLCTPPAPSLRVLDRRAARPPRR
jgi:hypothetical protein